jgi:hypothetical protein
MCLNDGKSGRRSESEATRCSVLPFRRPSPIRHDLKPPPAAVVKSNGSERCGNVGPRFRQATPGVQPVAALAAAARRYLAIPLLRGR